jgi:hypothetical protein
MGFGVWNKAFEQQYAGFNATQVEVNDFTDKQQFILELKHVFSTPKTIKRYPSFDFYFKANKDDELCWISIELNEQNKTYTIFAYCLQLKPDNSSEYSWVNDYFAPGVLDTLLKQIAHYFKYHSEDRLTLLFGWKIIDSRNSFHLKDITNI